MVNRVRKVVFLDVVKLCMEASFVLRLALLLTGFWLTCPHVKVLPTC